MLLNALGITDSGGITVLEKCLQELKNSTLNPLICYNPSLLMDNLVKQFIDQTHFEFIPFPKKTFYHRIWIENWMFRSLIQNRNIMMIYNFSGSAQFFSKVPQITKVHNLLFYSQQIDQVYFEKKQYMTWFKQIFLKRVIFHSMLKQARYIEVQSNHVKEYMDDFIDISQKHFFIKSDIEVKEELFRQPKEYDFSKKLRFLYIVGPHFEYLHKNFIDFVKTMKKLKENGFTFEVVVTLTKEQLHASTLWDKELDERTTFLGYVSKDELKYQFQDNTILISTSVIETLGLHVVESIQNGILTIVPNEKYSKDVYGPDVFTYELFAVENLVKTVEELYLQNNSQIKDIIQKNQTYLKENEKTKYQSIVKIFDAILKDHDVQK